MGDRDDPPPSYDPRSWAQGSPPRREPAAEASFDPRTWAASSVDAAAPSPLSPAEHSPNSVILAGAVALILLGVGGGAAYMARDDQPATVSAEPRPEVVMEPE